jgi:bifunctional DNase/RNase
MLEVRVRALALDEKSNMPVVLLKEKEGDRVLPIWIGPAEASAIAMELEGITAQRPMTHDLMKSLIDGLEARVLKVCINALKKNTFFARIFLQREGSILSVDARPSDSIALALRADAPIFVADDIIESKPSTFAEHDEKHDPAKSLRDHLKELDLKDFGRLKD